MRTVFFTCLLLSSAIAMGQQPVFYTSLKLQNKIPHQGNELVHYTYSLLSLDNDTYGYDVYANGVLLLHQPNMPGKPERTGFSSKEDAGKVAQRIILKLQHPVAPPVVSTAELQLLNIK